MMRHREQEEMRRQPDGFKPNYMDSREQDMRMGDIGPRGAINMGDAYNPATAGGNQGPPQMMGMNMTNRGGAMGPEGAPNMGTPMMPDNGAMVTFPQGGGPPQLGSPMGSRPGVEPQQQQPPMVGAVPVGVGGGGPGGFGRGN
ncbi:hypothetical protein JZ751_028166, partial [Albula glossodonta]